MSDETPTADAQPTLPEPAVVPDVAKPDDGSVVVTLSTEAGEAEIRVPPRGKWKSMARNRLSQGDDLGWAVLTLSREDAEAWIDLDPDQEESSRFFGDYDKAAPVNNRADRRRHLRSA
jgi:hypothetical protein